MSKSLLSPQDCAGYECPTGPDGGSPGSWLSCSQQNLSFPILPTREKSYDQKENSHPAAWKRESKRWLNFHLLQEDFFITEPPGKPDLGTMAFLIFTKCKILSNFIHKNNVIKCSLNGGANMRLEKQTPQIKD